MTVATGSPDSVNRMENITNCVAVICAASDELIKDECELANALWSMRIGADVLDKSVTSVFQALVS